MKLKIAKEDFYPLYRKGDKFVIVKRNTDENLAPVEAKHLKSKEIYGFCEEEFE